MEQLKILLIADIHYINRAKTSCLLPERKTKFGLEFLQRIRNRILAEKNKPDAIILLGDLIDNGLASGAEHDLKALKQEIEKFKIPAFYILGNHDGEYSKFYSIFPEPPNPYFINNYLLYLFTDSYQKGDFCFRRKEELKKFSSVIKKYPGKKVIVFQHNPVYPEIESTYPYNLVNSSEVCNFYLKNKVLLSISGHYHHGQNLTVKDKVWYLSVPALCEEPFTYIFLEIKGEKINLSYQFLNQEFSIPDNHCHTQFAFCAEDITIESSIERAKLFNLNYICFTEHYAHLYIEDKNYNGPIFFFQPDLLKRQKEKGINKVQKYKQMILKNNSGIAKIGLEVEVDKNGKIILLSEDRIGLDLLVGAIHFLPEEFLREGNKKLEKKFMWAIESLLKEKIDVLAHPFRFFFRNKLPTPKYLYKAVAKMLKEANVSAELNFHTNKPDPEFFRICLEEGVKISLGSDAHNVLEVGEFKPHLDLLKTIGISSPEQISKILFTIH